MNHLDTGIVKKIFLLKNNRKEAGYENWDMLQHPEEIIKERAGDAYRELILLNYLVFCQNPEII